MMRGRWGGCKLTTSFKSLAQWKVTDERELSEMTSLADDDTNIKKKINIKLHAH